MLTSSCVTPYALRLMQAKHAAGEHQFGVDGETGKVVDMKDYGLYESAAVKVQTIKTAIEVSSHVAASRARLPRAMRR